MVDSKTTDGHRSRMRKLFLNANGNLEDYQLLEILLFSVLLRCDTKVIAKNLLSKFGTIKDVMNADYDNLINVPGVNHASAVTIMIVKTIYTRIMRNNLDNGIVLQNWKDLIDYLLIYIGMNKVESVIVFYMNKKFALIRDDLHSVGDVDRSVLYKNKIVRTALNLFSSNILVAHNHPSGDITPSEGDLQLTESLCEACKMMDIQLIDHIIVANGKFFSFKKHGLI